MARPKVLQGDVERLNMVITTAETAEIEKWRYENRVPSKSEAIRRLVQMGLRLDRDAENIVNALRDSQDSVKGTWEKLHDAYNNSPDDETFRKKIISLNKKELRDMVDCWAEANNLFFAMLNEIENFKGSPSMAEAMQSAKSEREIMQHEVDRLRLVRAQRSKK